MQSGLETHFPKQARFPDSFPDFLVLHNNKMSLFFEKILFQGSQPPLNSFYHHPQGLGQTQALLNLKSPSKSNRKFSLSR